MIACKTMATKTHRVERGTKVSLEFGASTIQAIVIDDHGPIGPGGIRLLRVRAELNDGIEPLEFDVREDDVKAMSVRRRRAA